MHQMPLQKATSRPAVDLDERAAPRFTLLIRTAKLIVEDCEFLCLLRDVSATGVSIRLFHPHILGTRYEIEFETGQRIAADLVWQENQMAGFAFHAPIQVEDVMMGEVDFPRRDLRFGVEIPVQLHSRTGACNAELFNLSRQGGRIRCATPLALDQPVRIVGPLIPEIEARVRWRTGDTYGLIFDTTFSLAQLAQVLRDLHS